MLGVLAVGVLLALGVALLVGCALAWVYPHTRARVLRLAPGRASDFLLGLSLVPWVIGFLSVLVCLLPSAFAGLNPAWDHCLEHRGHPHLCLAHGHWQPTLLGLVLIMGLTLGVTVPLVRFLWTYRKGRRSLASMLALGEPDQGFFRLRVAQPLAFTTGIVRPKICLSEGLLDTLPEPHLAVVLAHETAHQRRRDGLRLLLAEGTTLILIPQFRVQLLEDLLQTTELACDAAAAHRVGDALVVAEALLAASRLHLGAWPGLWRSLPALGGGHLRPRVDALLNPKPCDQAWWAGARILPVSLLLVGLLAALSGEVHHALESLLGLLSR